MLIKNLSTKEFHPLIQQFDSLETFTACYVDCLIKNADSTYKHEKHIENQNVANQDEQDIEREDRIQDREPSDNKLEKGLREKMIKHVIAGEKGTIHEDEVALEGINQSQLHGIQDESTVGSKQAAFAAFVRVVSSPSLPQQSKIDKLIGNPQCIVESMNKMHLGKREKGNAEGVCKFQTIHSRYFHYNKNHIYEASMNTTIVDYQ